MKALVTGATGFLGSNLVIELLKNGVEIRALVRADSKTTNLKGLNVEITTGDLLDKASLDNAISGCDVLFHTAALYKLWTLRPRDFLKHNVDGTKNVLQAALDADVSRVVYTSTASVFGHWKGGPIPNENSKCSIAEAIDGYHQSKFIAEAEALNYCSKGLDIVIVNPTAPIGPYDIKPTPTGRIILDFINGRIPAYIDTGINVVDVRDVARGHILAFKKGKTGERHILGNRNLTLKQLFKLIGDVVGMPPPKLRIPYYAALGLAKFDELFSAKLLKKHPAVPVAGVRMARYPMYFDSSKAISQLDMPQTGIENAIADAVFWFQANGLTIAKSK